MRLFIVFLLCVFNTQLAHAQNVSPIRPSLNVPDRSYYANPRYNAMVRSAVNTMPDNFNFGRFRDLYYQTRQYDPIGDDVVNDMQRLSYIVQHDENAQIRQDAMRKYQALLKEHLANIHILIQAIALSRFDNRFGNPQFFAWMRNGLMREVMRFGNGKTLADAYRVTTLSEETLLIRQLGLRVLNTQTGHEGRIYYNMHDVQDLRTGQKTTLFIDTTIPMRFLNAQYIKTRPTFEIERQ